MTPNIEAPSTAEIEDDIADLFGGHAEWFEQLQSDSETYPDFPLEPLQQKARFGIYDERSAGWYLDKLASLAERRARYQAQFKELIEAVDADEQRLKLRFEAELEDWAKSEIAARGGKSKTLKLMQGSISFRTVPARVAVKDEEEAFVYCRTAHPDLIITPPPPAPHLDKAGYRKLFEATGDSDMPGLEIIPARESMSIKFGKGESK